MWYSAAAVCWAVVAALVGLLVSSANAASCMSGIPCGPASCAPLGGRCINGECYDSSGTIRVMCMASMADFPGWIPFRSWFPAFEPLPPLRPLGACGDTGAVCTADEFCDPTGICRPSNCHSQFAYGCPADSGTLQKVSCPKQSGYTRCFESTSGGFKCYKGPNGEVVVCASAGQGGSHSSMSSGYQTAGGNGQGGYAAAAASGPDVAVGQAGPAYYDEVPQVGTQQYIVGEGPNDLTTAAATGQGPPGIAVINAAPDGSAVAAGSAAGDRQSVVTQILPGGSSVTSTSVSGPGAGAGQQQQPRAAASANAVSTDASAGVRDGQQPLYTPYAGQAGAQSDRTF
eukprot:GHRR01001770.1.p1 GENE.GHRR01001770.1~~GHRR01001770.1.p1  ORF type:complete len:343 (+),score=80.32 GHRR01001770.1:490-1518(+)